MKLSAFLLSTAMILSSQSVVLAAPHWEYEGASGAAKWGSLDKSFQLCEGGQAQSPFDIKPSIDADLPSIEFSYSPFSPKIVNNGHTIQVNVPAGSSITVGADTYQLLQFHFHTPSEYQIGGKAYPLEVHFVHKRTDGALGVVGVMFEEGTANAELEKIWKNMPATAGEKDASDVTLDVTTLLPTDQLYYRFMGSLTTPPCSEGVNWHMMQQPITASKEQIKAFQKLFPMNARPLQPANNRLIVKDNK
jgi:carbonic anhydrase